MKYTNKEQILPVLAVAVLEDNYDYEDNRKILSATTIIKPIKVLAHKIWGTKIQNTIDLSDLVNSFIGNSIHTAAQVVWESGRYHLPMKKLGYSKDYINRILVNPTEDDIKKAEDPICVFLEQRSYKKFKKYIISGKYDSIYDGYLSDIKSTSVYKVVKMLKDVHTYNSIVEDYIHYRQTTHWEYLTQVEERCPYHFEYLMQGSVNAMLNKDKITTEKYSLQIVMKDWFPYMAQQEGYPNGKIIDIDLTLFSPSATERWIKNKLRVIHSLVKSKDPDSLPDCTPTELWMDKPQYKVFSSTDAKRAFKVFGTDSYGAYKLAEEKGGSFCVKVITPKAKACNYCNISSICKQRDKMIKTGMLEEN